MKFDITYIYSGGRAKLNTYSSGIFFMVLRILKDG